MAEDNLFEDGMPENEKPGDAGQFDDSGLGNLPPLSQFDSQGGFDSDGDLPPLGDFESQDTSIGNAQSFPPMEDKGLSSMGGSSLSGGLGTMSFSSEPAGMIPHTSSTGFQDLAADSDFSPETPDIGPGPDSTLDTPIFDSAFGGADSGFDHTSTATQAMESPIFDDFSGEGGFGGGVTPMPDFSPDTGFGDIGAIGGAGGAPIASPPGIPEPPSSQQAKVAKKGANPLLVAAVILFALLVGIFVGPYLADYTKMVPFPNPLMAQIDTLNSDIDGLKQQIEKIRQLPPSEEGKVEVSEERVKELINEIDVRTKEMESITGQLEATRATLDTQRNELNNVERDLRERNDEVIAAREFLDELRNETAIVQARQRGLIAEVDRLTGYVGELDEANQRRVATKEALEHNIDRMIIQVKESIPLAPKKFDYAERLRAVEALREKAAQAAWVTPELQNEYTSLYLRELELARSNEYFFAKVPVHDRFGHVENKWAECLMRGNWAVYYRTLDGANIGSYENVGTPETPRWGFREDMGEELRLSVESHIVASRIPDFEGQIQLLAERELAGKDGTTWQMNYSSL